MSELGVGTRPKPEKLPNTLEEGIAEIAYLRAIENMARRRQRILFRLWSSTSDYISTLEKERLCLERLYIPITHCKLRKTPIVKSREELLGSWKGKSQEEIDKLIAELEAM